MPKTNNQKRLDRRSRAVNLTLLLHKEANDFRVSIVAPHDLRVVVIDGTKEGTNGKVEFLNVSRTKTKRDYVEHLHDSLSSHVQQQLVDLKSINKFVS